MNAAPPFAAGEGDHRDQPVDLIGGLRRRCDG
jgi:hypothetical protein